MYLGGRLAKKSLNRKDIWTISNVDYMNAIINNIELIMVKEETRLPRWAKTPMYSDYTPELDATTELESNGITMYQKLIVYLTWAI